VVNLFCSAFSASLRCETFFGVRAGRGALSPAPARRALSRRSGAPSTGDEAEKNRQCRRFG
jgi:hypothetical protein